MIIRAVPVPPDLPEGFDAVIVVYGKSENRNTRLNARIEPELLEALMSMTPEKQVETIATITRLVEHTLLQCTVTKSVRRITDVK